MPKITFRHKETEVLIEEKNNNLTIKQTEFSLKELDLKIENLIQWMNKEFPISWKYLIDK